MGRGSDAEPVTQVLDADVWERWSSGPRWYYALAVVIRDPAVERRRGEVVGVLSDWLLPTDPQQLHATVRTLGFQPVDWRPRDVHLTVGPPDTFTAAAYLRVDSRQILDLRESLATIATAEAAWPPEDRSEPYLPHVTIGTYRKVVTIASVRSRLAQLSEVSEFPEIAVTGCIHQIAIDTRSPTGEWKIM